MIKHQSSFFLCVCGVCVIQVNAEFQCITTLQLETTFAAQLDRITPQLMTVFQKKGGVSGQKLAHHLQIMQEVNLNIANSIRISFVLSGRSLVSQISHFR